MPILTPEEYQKRVSSTKNPQDMISNSLKNSAPPTAQNTVDTFNALPFNLPKGSNGYTAPPPNNPLYSKAPTDDYTTPPPNNPLYAANTEATGAINKDIINSAIQNVSNAAGNQGNASVNNIIQNLSTAANNAKAKSAAKDQQRAEQLANKVKNNATSTGTGWSAPGIGSQYINQATATYDNGYNQRVSQENANYNNALAQYANQGNLINNNYTSSVNDTNRNALLTQNQFNANNLSRGLGRSTIATTGLAGISNTANRVIGDFTAQRDQNLNQLETLKATLKQNLDQTLTGLSADRVQAINALALQLQQRAEDVQYRNDQAAAAASRAAESQSNWQKQFESAQTQQQFENQLALAQLMGTYNGDSTFAKEQWLANTTGMYNGDPTFAREQWQAANNLDVANMTGYYNGDPTFAREQYSNSLNQWLAEHALDVANVTGEYNGQTTMAGAANSANVQGQLLQNEYQKLVNAGYPAEQAARLAQLQAQTQAQTIENQYLPAQYQTSLAKAASSGSSGGGSGSSYKPSSSSSSSNATTGQKLSSSQVTTYKKQIDSDFNAMMNATANDPAERTRWFAQYSPQILAATNNDQSYLNQLQAIANKGMSGYYGTSGSLH